MKIWIFSNVAFTAEEAPEVGEDDLLVFLNKAANIALYANHARKVVYHRSPEVNYGEPVAGVENRYVFGANKSIPGAFVDRLKQSYDWNYEIEPGKTKCMTTGYMVTKWMRDQCPDAEIALVNFGFDVKDSTYRCPWHNWKFEARDLAEFAHVFTAKTEVGTPRRRVFYELCKVGLGDNVYASSVVMNLAASRKFRFNVSENRHAKLWKDCPYLDRSITRDNADVVIRQRYLHPWKVGCPHLIEGTTDAAAFDLDTGIEAKCKWPRVFLPLPEARLVDGPYVVIYNGHQDIAPTKKWARAHWEKLVALLPDVHFVLVGQSAKHAFPIPGTESWIDRTEDVADLFRLVRDASAVVSIASAVVHIAAAFRVPCVMLSGGREPATLTGYPGNKAFSACGGELDCCRTAGCHRSQFGTGENECGNFVVAEDGDLTPTCMMRILPEEVAEAVRGILSC